MKKTLKCLTAAMIVFIIVFGSFSAFAEEEKEFLTWNDTECIFAGALAEGGNTVEIPSGDALYCIFDAEKAGFYTVTYDWRKISHFSSPVIGADGEIEDEHDYEYLEADEGFESDTYLFLFEEGENILVSFVGYEATAGSTSDIDISYCGEKVSDVSFEGGIEFDLVPEWNIYEYCDEEEEYPAPCYCISGGKTDIAFDSGKSISFLYHDFICTFEGEPEFGENNITVYFFNETFDKTVSVYPISKEITKVEVADIEKYLDVPVAYNSNLLYNFNGMEITLTYSDGYTETLTAENGEWLGIDLRNGNPHYFPLNYFHEREDDRVYFCLTIGDEEFIKEEGILRDATEKENLQHLNYRIYDIFSEAIEGIGYNFERLTWAENLWETVVYLRRAIFESADEFFTAFEVIVEEIAYCLRG